MSAAREGVPTPRAIHLASLLLAACAVAAAAMTVATLLGWRHFAPAAELYAEISTQRPDQVEQIVARVGGPLVVGGVTTLVTASLFGWMAVAVRRPGRRWAQITTWVAGALGAFFLIVDLNAGLTDTGSPSGMSLSPRDVLGYDLAPDWYPGLNAVLGLVTLAFLVAGTIAMTNSGVSDYHRKASWQRDDRWSSFVDRQKDHRQHDS